MFRRRRSLDDFSDEIESHLQLEIDRLQHEGLSPEAARAAARRAFGNVAASRERFYEARELITRAWNKVLAERLSSPTRRETAVGTIQLCETIWSSRLVCLRLD